MKIYRLIALVSLLSLSACQTNQSAYSTKKIGPEAALYQQISADLPAPEQLPPYERLYQSYLQHPAITVSSQNLQEFDQLITPLDAANCHTLDWQQQLNRNFWSLSFYRLATNCFEQKGDQANFKLFSAYQQYHLQGILSTGNGKQSYSAYRINSFADAHEVLQHLGMETQDYYAELGASGSALFYVVHAYDHNDNKFKKVFFQNQPYLYALEQYPYPFFGLSNGWVRILLPEFAKKNSVLGLPLAQVAIEEGRYAEAIQRFQAAIVDDSLQARVELAELCYLAKTDLNRSDCHATLIEAADRDYVPALELLLYLHHQGLIAKSTTELKDNIRNTINEMSGPGQAELALSRYYFSNTFGKRDAKKAEEWLKKAVTAGHPQAEFYLVVWQLDQKTLTAAAADQKYRQLAAKGSSEAAYRVASTILQSDKPSAEEIALARTLILQAKQAFHPEADYLLAVGYETQTFERPQDSSADVVAQLYLNSAQKFFPRAMSRVAELYLTGELLPRNAEMAHNWFLLCARLNNVSCAFNAGVMLDDGDGIPVNHEDAFSLFTFAADNGHTGAMNRMALMYLFGRGVDKDVNKALKLLETAAARGSESSRLFLGVIYLEGEFVKQDADLAKSHFTKVKHLKKAQQYLNNWPAEVKKYQSTK